MKVVLNYIAQKKQVFSKRPFFEYLRDSNVPALQKLAFAPCAAPFIMSFGELNKRVFRDDSSSDPLQLIINTHSRQDDHHWIWFLEDLEKLGMNPTLDFRHALTTLWSEESAAARQLVHELYSATYQCSPLQKLIVIETIEATGNVFLVASADFVKELEAQNQQRYQYFGVGHLLVETGHTYCEDEAGQYIESMALSGAERAQQYAVVDRIFAAFAAFTDALLAYAQKHPVSDFQTTPQPATPPRLGTCLQEAGLITAAQLNAALAEQQVAHQRLGEILSGHGWVKQETVDYLANTVIARDAHQPDTPPKTLALSH